MNVVSAAIITTDTRVQMNVEDILATMQRIQSDLPKEHALDEA